MSESDGSQQQQSPTKKDRFKISRPSLDLFPMSTLGKVHPIAQQQRRGSGTALPPAPPQYSQRAPVSLHSSRTLMNPDGADEDSHNTTSSKARKLGKKTSDYFHSRFGVPGKIKNALGKKNKTPQLETFPEVEDEGEPSPPSNQSRRRSTAHSLEFPPNIDFYRNTLGMEGRAPNARPSMMDLIDGRAVKFTAADEVKSVELFQTSPPGPGVTGPANKFGWIEGVLIRCMASIFGVMLYLRISWVAGQAGILLGSCVVLLGTLITIITALSTSAICTNGMVKGGGAYYLISRSLGPEFGGSIGIIFSFANAVGAAMYIVGFAETIRDLMAKHGWQIIDGDMNDIRIIGLVALVFIFGVIIVGLSFESKMQIVMMVVLLASVTDYMIGTFFSPSEDQQLRGLTGYRMETFKENLMPAFREGYSFFTVFAVYFPAATGIMAGANISGDLKDPGKAIPMGTLLAIAITSIVYLLMVWMTGSTCVRDADGIYIPMLLSQLNATGIVPEIKPVVDESVGSVFTFYAKPACVGNASCPYGLMNYFQIVELGSVLPWFVTAGIIASTLSSALVSMVGAPKIFQAVCKDRLFPYVNRFAKGHGPNDEPRQALILGSVIACGIILIGDLNAIAPIISNFFLCSYALINYACFDSSFAHSPGFRPSFRYYNMWVSLAGSFMCIFCMFIISWSTALLTFFCFVIIFMYLAHRKPDVNWGSSAQAHSYRNALQYVIKLERTDEHVKNYRPQVLVMSGNPAARAGLVDFAYSITKGNSLMMCGYVVPYEASSSVFKMMDKLDDELRVWFKNRHMKAFPVCVANPNLRSGGETLLQVAGLGKLKPNIIIMGFKHDWIQCAQKENGLTELNDYFGLILDSFSHNISVAILRNASAGLDLTEFILAASQWERSNSDHPVPASPTYSCTSAGDAGSSQYPTVELRGTPGQRARQMFLNTFVRGDARDILDTTSTITSTTTAYTTIDPNSTVNSTATTFTNLDPELGAAIAACSRTLNKDREAQRNGVKVTKPDETSEYPSAADSVQQSVDTRTDDRPTISGPIHVLSSITLPSDVNRFQNRVKNGVIDVWWLYDDGGLTLLVPYLLAQPKSYLENAKLRVFTLSAKGKKLEHEQRSMAALLSRFRIKAAKVIVLPDSSSNKPTNESLAKFDALIKPFIYHPPEPSAQSSTSTVEEPQVPDGMVTMAELKAHQEKSCRALRLSELLRKYSSTADLIVVTLPVPRRGVVSSALYLTWLEVISRDLPPTLMVRGNQQSVLTFYS
ncbi:solute carrier family 12 domain-containing protein [Ditylenchus destructor]|uniref:Solute carrier family 12 domain-containing protein n=1 Tax=Ditylenchus destructor TaxID=166010 RepID=A0AAD4N8B8_9BILA|nr:solute carrier family 12 domain-containing protein [Ditylenchus destructor]